MYNEPYVFKNDVCDSNIDRIVIAGVLEFDSSRFTRKCSSHVQQSACFASCSETDALDEMLLAEA